MYQTLYFSVNIGLQLQRRVYKGIPDRLRGDVWCRLLNVDKIKKEQPRVYQVQIQECPGTIFASVLHSPNP